MLRRHGDEKDVQVKCRDSDAECSPDDSQQKVLCKQLANNMPAPCTQRAAHGDLRPSGYATGQLEVGNVCAHHQQHKQRAAHDEPVVERRQVAIDVVKQRLDLYGPVPYWLRDKWRPDAEPVSASPLAPVAHLRRRANVRRRGSRAYDAVGKLLRSRREG